MSGEWKDVQEPKQRSLAFGTEWSDSAEAEDAAEATEQSEVA
jgi:hypothetical protein